MKVTPVNSRGTESGLPASILDHMRGALRRAARPAPFWEHEKGAAAGREVVVVAGLGEAGPGSLTPATSQNDTAPEGESA